MSSDSDEFYDLDEQETSKPAPSTVSSSETTIVDHEK